MLKTNLHHVRPQVAPDPDIGMKASGRRSRAVLLNMDVLKMLADLREQRAQIEQAITVMERLAAGQSKRRGRPPTWMAAVKRRGRPPGSKNKPSAEGRA